MVKVKAIHCPRFGHIPTQMMVLRPNKTIQMKIWSSGTHRTLPKLQGRRLRWWKLILTYKKHIEVFLKKRICLYHRSCPQKNSRKFWRSKRTQEIQSRHITQFLISIIQLLASSKLLVGYRGKVKWEWLKEHRVISRQVAKYKDHTVKSCMMN